MNGGFPRLSGDPEDGKVDGNDVVQPVLLSDGKIMLDTVQ